jgi:hypothetical protein
VAFLIGLPAVRADTWPPPPTSRTFTSVDGSAKAVEYSSGEYPRRAIRVYSVSRDGTEKLLWQADLVNCPVQILVAADGASVVTLDRWGSIGSDAIVFYRNGRVLRRYPDARRDLIAREEASNVLQSAGSFHWNREARAEFTPDGAVFRIRLAWGRMLAFDTSTGDPV